MVLVPSLSVVLLRYISTSKHCFIVWYTLMPTSKERASEDLYYIEDHVYGLLNDTVKQAKFVDATITLNRVSTGEDESEGSQLIRKP